MSRSGALSARESRQSTGQHSRNASKESAFGTLGELPSSARYALGHSGDANNSQDRAAAALGVLGDVSDQGSLLAHPADLSQVSLPLEPPLGSPQPRSTEMGKKEYEAMQKRKEHQARHGRLRSQWENDERAFKERCEREERAREQRFERMMEALRENDSERVYAGHIVNVHEAWHQNRREELHAAWHREVVDHLSTQVESHLQSARSSSDSPRVVTLKRGGDPIKRRMHEHLAEEQFRRLADSVIGTASEQSQSSAAKKKQGQTSKFSLIGKPRGALPVECWEQRKICASPLGHLAYNLDKGPQESEFTGKRIGAGVHIPDESDGRQAAGRTKGPLQYGILTGTMARDGQSSLLGTSKLGASGAPGQDHYVVDRSRAAVDVEFPRGKRTYYPDVPNR
mmetsp:Transcript_58724/g.137032  ORF Transcript_58724/g.137032 Transcript_58724/m.137032 type:complete len:398 (-) Transcript_58724:21-1214(-)